MPLILAMVKPRADLFDPLFGIVWRPPSFDVGLHIGLTDIDGYIAPPDIGGLRDDPDYCPLIIANRILGSSFTGRLFNNVRSRQGLAYSVYGIYSANYNYPGVFYVGCQTKSESTVKAIEAMRQEVATLTREDQQRIVEYILEYVYRPLEE